MIALAHHNRARDAIKLWQNRHDRQVNEGWLRAGLIVSCRAGYVRKSEELAANLGSEITLNDMASMIHMYSQAFMAGELIKERLRYWVARLASELNGNAKNQLRLARSVAGVLARNHHLEYLQLLPQQLEILSGAIGPLYKSLGEKNRQLLPMIISKYPSIINRASFQQQFSDLSIKLQRDVGSNSSLMTRNYDTVSSSEEGDSELPVSKSARYCRADTRVEISQSTPNNIDFEIWPKDSFETLNCQTRQFLRTCLHDGSYETALQWLARVPRKGWQKLDPANLRLCWHILWKTSSLLHVSMPASLSVRDVYLRTIDCPGIKIEAPLFEHCAYTAMAVNDLTLVAAILLEMTEIRGMTLRPYFLETLLSIAGAPRVIEPGQVCVKSIVTRLCELRCVDVDQCISEAKRFESIHA